MSASAKLKALKPEGLVVTDAPYEGYTDAVCLSISAHAAVVAVVEAAEEGRNRSVLIEERWTRNELVAWKLKDAQALQSSLAALDEALSSAPSR